MEKWFVGSAMQVFSDRKGKLRFAMPFSALLRARLWERSGDNSRYFAEPLLSFFLKKLLLKELKYPGEALNASLEAAILFGRKWLLVCCLLLKTASSSLSSLWIRNTVSFQLEEGEKDFVRSQEYKYCMHRWINPSIDLIDVFISFSFISFSIWKMHLLTRIHGLGHQAWYSFSPSLNTSHLDSLCP